MQRLVILCVLAGMFWQVVGATGRVALVGAGEDIAHALMHWSESAHHHQDDGSYDPDASDDAVRHVLADDALTAPALCPGAAPAFALRPMPSPLDTLAVALPEPFPDGLRRPPRHSA